MSGKQMGLVYDYKFTRSQREVLMSFADHAHHDGTSMFPSVRLTAWKIEMSTRQVQRIIKELVAIGVLVLVAEASAYMPNEYKFDWDKAEKKPEFEKNPKMSPLAKDLRKARNVTPATTKKKINKNKRSKMSPQVRHPDVTLTVNEPSDENKPSIKHPSSLTQTRRRGIEKVPIEIAIYLDSKEVFDTLYYPLWKKLGNDISLYKQYFEIMPAPLAVKRITNDIAHDVELPASAKAKQPAHKYSSGADSEFFEN